MEIQRALTTPVNVAASFAKNLYTNTMNPLAYTQAGRSFGAYFELLERITRNYAEPEFGIKSVKVDGKAVAIKEVLVTEKTFCRLIHFKKEPSVKPQPKMLIVAPLSGHFATLLRGTVQDTLPYFDVYITDWANARDIPMSLGPFDFDDYVDYVIAFTEHLGSNVNLMAVCQPSVPVMAAVAIMSAKNNKYTPDTMTLIGGPIDTRVNPTKVNKTAYERPIEWFEQNVITHVPVNYPGFMRKVYPGFIQLSGFMSMNLDRHIGEHLGLFMHLVQGDGDSAEAHKKFYNEYLAVMDLPAEFYLQTVRLVFQEFALPKGKMVSRGRPVKPEAITKTALLAVEGERDDISGVGQTKAAIDLCKGLPADKKKYHLQKEVGHYGSFNGRRFREEIVPTIFNFVSKHSKA
ncbi:MAG: polyhydroxyalkanoate depolymerase [Proteobacteria bacterium]|nr:polyhydroxyalkanoate depolymerase [Pseudomonadota bacterium]